ncbi:MAG: flavin reductase [Patulibacter sp.]
MSATATPHSALPATELRRAMGRFATGVTVITARDDDARPAGTTVSAVSSLSLDPPLLLICLDRRSQTLKAVRDHDAFAVNVLGAHHRPLSDAFARSANSTAWDGVSHRDGRTGSPLLDDAHVALDCRVERIADGGDHEIVIGRIVEIHHPSDDADHEPLLFYGGRYARLTDEPDAAERELRVTRDEAAAQAVDCQLPTAAGNFRLVAHERSSHDLTAALVYGDPASHPAPVVHAQVACLLGDALRGLACDCAARLAEAQQAIIERGAGVLLYTKRYGVDAELRCAAAQLPDIAIGAGLLQRIGVRHAAFLDPSSAAARRLAAAAEVMPLHADRTRDTAREAA